MVYDLLIIGAGLSGLFAGCLAARRGKHTLILARGIGSTHVGTGTIDVARGGDGLATLLAAPGHPYQLVGRKALGSALKEFQAICAEAGYPMTGEPGRNFKVPTASGSARETCLLPATMLAGDLSLPDSLVLAGLPGFRDFYGSLAAQNLNARALNLPLPRLPAQRDSYATDLALLFDLPDYRDEVVQAWKPLLMESPRRLGLPACLGLEKPLAALDHLEKALGLKLFEIPVLPPSVPGMRLFNLLRDDFQNHGGRLILGPDVRGTIDAGRARVAADAHGRQTEYRAEVIFLATGGFLNGGLEAEFDGSIREPVFNLPVLAPAARSAWTAERFLDPQPFARFGVRTNRSLQPLNAGGKPAAGNLRVIGSILAGADRLTEGSREGIELATAWRAVETIV